MNDFVLRGFCQKCEWPIELVEEKPEHCMLTCGDNKSGPILFTLCKKIKPVWFLSAKQMDILRVSRDSELSKWAEKKGPWKGKELRSEMDWFARLLEEKPFLVAKILKENEVKKE